MGAFYLDGRLGAGGQGVVYEGYGPDGTRVAVKALHRVGDADRENLRKEVRAWRRVEPFCTAKVLQDDIGGPVPFVVSEYVAGADLRRAVASGAPFGPEELRRLAIGVATALVAIHRADVVHRDLKPENILLGPDGPRVIDFGIARVLVGSASAGLPMGTLRYMPPERYNGEPGDGKVDVWAWGAVILFAATGRDAFDGDSPAVLMLRVAGHHPDTSGLGEPLRSLVDAALSKDPEERPTSEELLLSLVGRADLAAAVKTAAGGGRRGPRDPSRAEIAEAVFARLDPEAQEAVSAVLLRLVAPGERAEDTLRSARRAEFADDRASDEAVDRVLREFTASGILIRDGDAVTLATAALIRSWPRLRTWVDAERQGLSIHQRLAEATRTWNDHGRRKGDLLQGTALDRARDWAATGRRLLPLNRTERDFLAAGAGLARRRSRNRTLLGGLLAILTVTAVLLGLLFASTREEARERRAAADSRALAQASRDTAALDPVQATMLAIAGYQTAPTQEARNQLLRQYLGFAGKRRVLSGVPGEVRDFDTSRDGNVVLSLTDQALTTVFVGALSGPVRSRPVDLGYARDVVVSSDGRRAAFVTFGDIGWFPIDPSAADPVGAVHRLSPFPAGKSGTAVAMSADGTRVAALVDKRLLWWDLDNGSRAGEVAVPQLDSSGGNTEVELWFGQDNRTLLATTTAGSGEGLVSIDVATGATRTVIEPRYTKVLPSGDRTAVAVSRDEDTGDGSTQTVVVVRRLADGADVGRPYLSRGSDGKPKAVDATGRHILVGEAGAGALRLVDTNQGTVVNRPYSGYSRLYAPALVPAADGRLLLVGGSGKSVVYEEVSAHEGVIESRDRILLGDGSRSIHLLKDESLQLRTVGDGGRLLVQAPRPELHGGRLVSNRDDTLIALREGKAPNIVEVRDAATLRPIARITGTMPPIRTEYRLADFEYFFVGTSRLVTVSGTLLQQWDARTGALLATTDVGALLPPNVVNTNNWSANPSHRENQVVLVALGDPVIRIVDLVTGHTTESLDIGLTDVRSVQFDSGGRYFALVRQGNVVELWRHAPLRKELGPLPSFEPTTSPGLRAARFIDDKGHYMIGANNFVRIYEIGRQAYAESYEFGFPDNSSRERSFDFVDASKDGKVLAYAVANSISGTLLLDPGVWKRDLCDIIGNRSFTTDERDGLPVRIPTKPVCPLPYDPPADPQPTAAQAAALTTQRAPGAHVRRRSRLRDGSGPVDPVRCCRGWWSPWKADRRSRLRDGRASTGRG
ncbi:protein kinase [Embleya sp. NPDC056575]|uniref:protein kinase domain-containing protein n=1 Tax=unclassified Embleya TaxID=2699296 RepID=UPI00369A8E6D